MPALPTPADRAAEFNRLLVEQAGATRSMKYGWKPDDKERAAIDARATRLLELAELIGAPTTYKQTAGEYVNERIAAWLRMNPLPLALDHLGAALDNDPIYTEGGVLVTIGELGNYGYQYRVMRDDFRWSGAHTIDIGLETERVIGDIVLTVPDSVAEHFRQQGRRQLQSELRDLLNTPRA